MIYNILNIGQIKADYEKSNSQPPYKKGNIRSSLKRNAKQKIRLFILKNAIKDFQIENLTLTTIQELDLQIFTKSSNFGVYSSYFDIQTTHDTEKYYFENIKIFENADFSKYQNLIAKLYNDLNDFFLSLKK